MTTFDHIVVGAGSAGCVVASRLSEDPGTTVLLLEAGGEDTDPAIHDPTAWPTLWDTPADWALTTTAQPSTAGRTHRWPRGKVLGGSSSINALLHVRGHRADFDGWAAAGNTGWAYRDVLPLFRRSESYAGGDPAYHGTDGPLHVGRITAPNATSLSFVEAATEAGHGRNDDPNGASMDGVSHPDLIARAGRRQSAAVAYLRPARSRPNLTVLTGAHALRLLVDGDRCTGVEYRADGRVQRARADSDVVLSAGAVASPHLLMLSGIGPADHLREHGLPVLVDLPGVGRNLQDHLLACVINEADEPIPAHRTSTSEVQLFADPSEPGGSPGTWMLFLNVPYYAPGQTGPANAYTIAAAAPRLAGRGSVRLRSGSPDTPALLDPRYLDDPGDLDLLVDALVAARDLARHRAFDRWRPTELHPGPDVTSRADLARYVRGTTGTYHHQSGTCRMGVDDTAVVDPGLAVRGLSGLRVADASIMPIITSANTNAPTIMIGERAADLVRAAR